MLDDILKNYAVYVDGRGYAGNAEEVEPPKLNEKVEEMRAGGMDAPMEVGMGMEKLECNITLTRFDKAILKRFGLSAGNTTPLTLRGSLESEDGTKTPVVINMRGKIKGLDYGTWKAGEKATLKIAVGIAYYKLKHGGEVVHEIDVINMKRVINGVDQLREMRAHLGM